MITTNDQERAAYIAGDVRTAELLGRLMDAEALADPDTEDRLRSELDDMELDKDEAEDRADELADVLRAAVDWFDKNPACQVQTEPAWVDEARGLL